MHMQRTWTIFYNFKNGSLASVWNKLIWHYVITGDKNGSSQKTKKKEKQCLLAQQTELKNIWSFSRPQQYIGTI